MKTSNLTDNACEDCGHAKILHPKALGYCAVCVYFGNMCRRWFPSIFSQDELEKLTSVPKDSFDQWAVCAICEGHWMEHRGALCPNGCTTFKPLVGYA